MLGIKQPRCALTFGVGACEATGTPCYNTWATCKFKEAYDLSASIEWMFARDGDPFPDTYSESGDDIRTNPIPTLKRTSSVSSSLNVATARIGESPFGIIGKITFQVADFPWRDDFGDPYRDDRAEIIEAPFWAKWKARIGEAVTQCTATIYTGYEGDAIGDMQAQSYDLRTIDGPANGGISGTADAPLRKLNEARFPRSTEIQLEEDIEAADTSIRVSAAVADLEDAFGNTGAQRYIRIGSEIIGYTGYTEIDAPVYELTGVTRGALATEVDDHSAEDACQRVGHYVNIALYNLARDLIQNHSILPNALIEDAEWDQEGGTFLSTIKVTGTVPEPTKITELLGEIARDGLFSVWWDDRAQTIPLLASRAALGVPVFLSDEYSIIQDSATLRVDTEERKTRVTMSYGQINPVKGLEDFTNYRKRFARIFGEGETEQFADGAILDNRIFSRWIRTDANALRVRAAILAELQFSPQYLVIELDAKDRAINIGDQVDLQSRVVVNADGSKRIVRWRVIRWQETQPGHKLRLELALSPFPANKRYGIIMENDAPVYGDATEAERASGCWLADETTGLMPNGDQPYLLW